MKNGGYLMKTNAIFFMLIAAAALPPSGLAQHKVKKPDEEAFVKQSPTIGELFPDLTVYDPNGREVQTSSLRGHYTSVTFGCLT